MHTDKLTRLAEADRHNVVNQIQEVFADFVTLNDCMFSLGMDSILGLQTTAMHQWNLIDNANAN